MSISKWAELADEHNFPGDWAPYCCEANSRFLRSLSFPVSRAQLLSSWLQPNSPPTHLLYSYISSLPSYPIPLSPLLAHPYCAMFSSLELVASWQQQGAFNQRRDGGEMTSGVTKDCEVTGRGRKQGGKKSERVGARVKHMGSEKRKILKLKKISEQKKGRSEVFQEA